MESLKAQQWVKAVVTLVAAIVAAFAAQVGGGELSEIDGNGYVKIAVVLLGGTALTAFVTNIPGVFGGVIKAVIGASTAFFTSLATAYENDAFVTQGEILTAAALGVATLAAVYQIPEPPPKNP